MNKNGSQQRAPFPALTWSSAPYLSPPLVPAPLERALTLIELLVVIALLALFVGGATLSLDGVTVRGRLRSAARNIGAFHALARIEAISSGRPRRVVFQPDASCCLVQKPEPDGRRWKWSAGRSLQFATRVHVARVIVQGKSPTGESTPDRAIRVAADGTSPHYACILTAGESALVVVIDGVSGNYRLITGIDPVSVDREALFAGGLES